MPESKYPPVGSAEWWKLRRELFASFARNRYGPPPTPAEPALSDAAIGTAEGDGPARGEYEAIDRSTGLHKHLSPALAALREKDPARFAAISAEARRLQALGKPNRSVLAVAAKALPR